MRLTLIGLVVALRLRIVSSVRAKLLALVLAPLVFGLPILIGLVIYWANTSYDSLLIMKINGDLVTAQKYFERVIDSTGAELRALSRSSRLERILRDGKPATLEKELAAERNAAHLDFLNLYDANARLIASTGKAAHGSSAGNWPVIDAAKAGIARAGIDIYFPEQLGGIDSELRERAELPLVETKNAAPTDRRAETRGMIVHAAVPVFDAKGRLAAILEGGMMLNRNLEFVDRINDIVYRQGSLPEGSHGTATLFLDDVRISTNVRLFRGERALGTRVSKAVRDHVLGEGKVWLDSAFVVKDWYVSAYEPILDSRGERVGMLYVGYLEEPFRQAKYAGLTAIIILFVAISILGSLLSLSFARRIFRPLERMHQVMEAVESGDGAARVGELESRDEIGRIARDLDNLLATLERRNTELRSYADDLDRKVAARTAELERANQSLRDTQRQLVMSEKLAAIGQLTAGVAHEINNPIAVIQGNLDVLRHALGGDAHRVSDEIRLIDEQVNRVRVIVTKLLQFARPEEFAGYVEQVDVNAAIADMLVLVRHELKAGNIRVEQRLNATRQAGINRNELLQVLINIAVNAIHAMPEGGTLSLESADWERHGVNIAIADSGIGIAAEDLPRIFDPFFTTRKQQGTGLGLSISYALIERYGGRISVESQPGKGSTFTLHLLTEPDYQSGAAAYPPEFL